MTLATIVGLVACGAVFAGVGLAFITGLLVKSSRPWVRSPARRRAAGVFLIACGAILVLSGFAQR